MASVFLNDLANDYLNPSSQGCINPLFTEDDNEEEKTSQSIETEVKGKKDKGRTMLSFETDNDQLDAPVRESLTVKKSKKATVSVADCLACSGCVTSTEAVLVTETYSLGRLREAIGDEGDVRVVFTISEATVVELTRYFCDFKMVEVCEKLEIFLRSNLGAEIVTNAAKTNIASLVESKAEFIHRYKNSISDSSSASRLNLPVRSNDHGPSPSVAISAEETRFVKSGSKLTYHKAGRDGNLHSNLPVLTSSCPGFVCYVEKTAPYAIPYLSTVKSPMAISGAIHKHMLLPSGEASKRRIFHIAIMPCHDKKLEGGRKDLAWNQVMNGTTQTVPDVDLVITTAELLQLMKESAQISKFSTLSKFFSSLNVKLVQSHTTTSQRHLSFNCDDGFLFAPTFSHSASQSGSYADYVFRTVSEEMFDYNLGHFPLPWKAKSPRNTDLKELVLYRAGSAGAYTYSLTNKSGSEAVLRFAQAYGFRNIQGILQRMKKSGKMGCSYDYVEIMACPSGCMNGGGQIRHDTEQPGNELGSIKPSGADILISSAEKLRESPAEVRKRIQKCISILEQRQVSDVTSNSVLQFIYSTLLSSDPFSDEAQRIFHTRFHTVPKLELSSGAVEGLNPDDAKW